ncbi:MAG: chromate efflux transporter [Thermodesulfobacteria bacterium]|nr:chromate efflux transporter [Thermodesulfobacteriota bacterium]
MEGPPSLIKLFVSFLKLGLTAFGGPAMVKYIKDLSCRKNHWVDPEVFDHGIALVQTIPGATAMQAAAYAGLKARGGAGALVAFTGFALPAFFLMLALAAGYKHAMNIDLVVSCFKGLKVIVVAIVANATLGFGKKMIRTWQDLALMIPAAAYLFFKGSPVVVILACALAGIFLYRKVLGSSSGRANLSGVLGETDTRDALKWAAIVALIAVGVLGVLYLVRPFLFKLCAIMMKVDFFAYGGGYASLPLMLHEIVEKRGLLDKAVFMDGIALGQVTPGPIVITAAFVGYLLSGVLGAVLCAWAIFTPSLFMLLVTSPFYDGFKDAALFKRAMRGVLASFVGLLLAVFLSFAMAVHWGPASLTIGIAAFLALYKKVDILWVVLVAALISAIIL